MVIMLLIVLILLSLILLILNTYIMKDRRISYLVSKKGTRGFKTVYEIYQGKHCTEAILLNTCLGSNKGIIVGIVKKENNRGVTIESGIFNETLVTIFLSNGAFDRVTTENEMIKISQ